MYKGLRDYINYLDANGELITIDSFVDPLLEIAEITDRISKMEGGGKAILFNNTGTDFPVLTNMMGSEKRVAMALGIDSFEKIDLYFESLFKDILKERNSFIDKLKLLPYLKEASQWMPKKHYGAAPCQEVIMPQPDLSKLPVLKCWPEDGGRFITLPMVHTIDQKSGAKNLGMYRMQIFSNTTTGMHWHRHKTGAKHFSNFDGDKFPIAVALGGDPVYTYAATAPLPDGIDEYILAGFLRKKAVKLTKCLTQPLMVPVDCDFIIEGYIEKNSPLVVEGPFGDHTGFYSLADLYPLMHITAITHRKDAVYPATLVGIPPQEDKYIALATEKIFLNPIKFTFVPEIVDMHLPEEGVGHNIAFIKIDKSYPGQAIKVASALWGAGQMMFNKIMIVADRDTDIRDRDQLLKAIIQNYNPSTDTHFSKGPLDVLDHASNTYSYGGKVLIDATKKMEEEISEREFTPERSVCFNFTHLPTDISGLINIVVDENIDTDDIYSCMWIWGSNCDPIRDSLIESGVLIMDSKTKHKGEKGFNREWPKMALSSKDTIESIDNKWKELNIGPMIESPSKKYIK